MEKLGAGVSTRAVGDRVAIAWPGYACGECRYCIGGWETLCLKQENSGYSVNGTFAEYALAPAAFATPVPDAISSFDGAPLTCAGVTTFKAIKVAGFVPGETAAIFGVGGADVAVALASHSSTTRVERITRGHKQLGHSPHLRERPPHIEGARS